MIVPLNPTPQGVNFIVKNYLAKAADNEVDEIICLILEKKATLWTVVGKGFLVLYVERHWPNGENEQRNLVVQCAEGKDMFRREFMRELELVAKYERCGSIVCQSKNPSVVKWLKRQGFEAYESVENWTLLRKGI